ncbi:NAD-dependent epimerase/dehydratase family protein [Microbacterium sp. ASV49]|uniref:NAD(P)H-binding protein n=1 Tax=Microbacterium candidum TaxID=3041922 RepID=A0ABT7MY85_9MICO|nr:NAD-dependent epimerase/dehydratase family protein [Microbacterium sp. ASV49]MDL9979422.1 NAD(P)H-binding protein [Microbacterium sp. ASV49]
MTATERILLVGATGVLGAPATRALVAAGHEVHGTSRRAERLSEVESSGARGVVLDALDPASIDAALAEVQPTTVIFLATDLASFDYAANARLREVGAPALVEASHAAGVDRVIAESISWDPHSAPVAALEHAVMSHPGGMVLRFGLLYGPGTWYAADGATTARAGVGVVDAIADTTNWLHVDDAVSAVMAALTWPVSIFDIVDDEPAALEDWAAVLARRAGYAGVPRVTSRGPARVADGAAARSLGWRPAHPSWRDGLGL